MRQLTTRYFLIALCSLENARNTTFPRRMPLSRGGLLQHYEKTTRTLHDPTILAECRHFWTAREAQISVFSDFLPQIVSILAIELSLQDRRSQTNGFLKNRSFVEMTCYGLVYAWLDSLDRTRRIELFTLRTQPVPCHTCSANSVYTDRWDVERYWHTCQIGNGYGPPSRSRRMPGNLCVPRGNEF